MAQLDFKGLKSRINISDFMADHFDRAPSGGHICPFCGSGTGPNGTGALTPYDEDESFYCHHCHRYGDVFDLAGAAHEELETPIQRYEYVEKWLELHGGGTIFAERRKPQPEPDLSAAQEAERVKVAAWRENIEDPDAVAYLVSRGIPLDAAKAIGLGYDSVRRRLVIPFPGNGYYHIDRAIDADVTPKYVKPSKEAVGPAPLWNPAAFGTDHIVVVEGAFDAFAVEACGHPAVALTGTGSSRFVAEAAARQYAGEIIILLDNDDAGHAATETLCNELGARGFLPWRVPYPAPDPGANAAKDPSELHQADPAKLAGLLDGAIGYIRNFRAEQAVAPYRQQLESIGCFATGGAAGRILALEGVHDPVPTGIVSLDSALGGGLPVGLAGMAAASSLGKTGLVLQISANLAESGYVVVYYSLEMSLNSLIARIVSHLAYRDSGVVLPPSCVTSPSARAGITPDQVGALEAASARYDAVIGPGIYIAQPAAKPTVLEIEGAVASAFAIAQTKGMRGVVLMVDYLQLIAPAGAALSERSIVEDNVVSLKRISRDWQVPVLAISSLNRASYFTEVSLDSFKEAGGIEYGCDLLLGLQPAGLNEKARELKNAKEAPSNEMASRMAMDRLKRKPVREVELTVIKNRDGAMPPGPIKLDFVPAASTFVDVLADPARHQAAMALLNGPTSSGTPAPVAQAPQCVGWPSPNGS